MRIVRKMAAAALLLTVAVAVLSDVAAEGSPIEEVELGIYDILSAETTPIMWQGELMVVEGRLDSPSDERIHVGGEPILANGTSHFRVRKKSILGHGTNDVVVPLIPDTVAMTFCNAHVSRTGPGGVLGQETLWVFATNDDTRWGAPPRTQVHAFWSFDPLLKTWNHSVALQLPHDYAAWNTDVTEGPGGYAYMAIELNAPAAIVGNPFTSVFAKTMSSDLSQGWELLDPTTHVYTKARYSACPTIRYFPEDGYFYMTTLFGGVPNGTNAPLQHSDEHSASEPEYPCCFVTWLVRSQNLSTWEESSRNPLMGWPDWSDRVIEKGSLLDTLGNEKQKTTGTNQTYNDINRSDQDMVELPESFVAKLPGERVPPSGPWTYMVFAAGDQLSMGFGAAIVAKASMHDYLSSFF